MLAYHQTWKNLPFFMKQLNQTENSIEWFAWFDGSCKPNPGECRIACVIKGPDNFIFEHLESAGYGDSSDAEYLAMIATIRFLHKYMRAGEIVRIHGDSQVVIGDVTAGAAKTSAVLTHHRQEARELLAQLPGYQLKWVPRHKNVEADQLLRK